MATGNGYQSSSSHVSVGRWTMIKRPTTRAPILASSSNETLTGISLDDVGHRSVWHVGEVEPSSVCRGTGIAVPPRVEGFLATDDTVRALAPKIPSKCAETSRQVEKNMLKPFALHQCTIYT